MDKYDALREMEAGKTVKSQYGWLYKISNRKIVYWNDACLETQVEYTDMNRIASYEVCAPVVKLFSNLDIASAIIKVLHNKALFAIGVEDEGIGGNAFGLRDDGAIAFYQVDHDGKLALDECEDLPLMPEIVNDKYNIYNIADLNRLFTPSSK